MKRMLITGAAGKIGSVLVEHFKDRYDLVLLTHREAPFESIVADIADLDAIAPAFEGVDLVIHLAAKAKLNSPWPGVLSTNIIGTYNVFEAARLASVDLVVFASTHHVVGMYEAEWAPSVYDLDDPRTIDETSPVRPDSLYAVSKVFGEALAKLYVEKFDLRAICLRIGAVRDDDDPRSDSIPGYFTWLNLTDEESYARIRAIWLSKRDCVALFEAAIESPIDWGIAYGTSNNPRQIWDLSAAREIGYEPQDGAPQ